MSRTDTALKPLVENSSSAAHRIASRMFGLREPASVLVDLLAMICTSVQKIRSSQQETWALVLAANEPVPRPLVTAGQFQPRAAADRQEECVCWVRSGNSASRQPRCSSWLPALRPKPSQASP